MHTEKPNSGQRTWYSSMQLDLRTILAKIHDNREYAICDEEQIYFARLENLAVKQKYTEVRKC